MDLRKNNKWPKSVLERFSREGQSFEISDI